MVLLSLGMSSVKVAAVDTPELHVLKAKAEVEGTRFSVTDRRDGRVIVQGEALSVQGGEESGHWLFTMHDGSEVSITRSGGCGCGGTLVTTKEQATP